MEEAKMDAQTAQKHFEEINNRARELARIELDYLNYHISKAKKGDRWLKEAVVARKWLEGVVEHGLKKKAPNLIASNIAYRIACQI